MKKFAMPSYVRFLEGEGEAPAPSEDAHDGENRPAAEEKSEPLQLPDDHPLVKAYAAQKEEIKNLRSRSEKLAEIEDASKSELERATESAAKAEARAAEAEARALRREVALESGLSKEDAAYLDALTDEDAMRSLAARLAKAAEASTTKQGVFMDQSGRQRDAAASNEDLAREIFGL